MPTYEELGLGRGIAVGREHTRAVFGQVMGLVALTVGSAALGAYVGRTLTGGTGIGVFIAAMVCVFGLNFAAARGHEQLAIGLLLGMGLLLGIGIGPVLHVYAKSDPSALWQAADSTAAFVGALGAYGYATRRDLSSWARTLFWALLALIAFGIVAIFVAIPHANIIYCVLGLVVFGGFTVFDFNRLRRANPASAVPIAAGIFLDIFNVFLFMLRLFGGSGRD
ncbi:MAG: Bax inhibitor-1/YccA family protein [Solirubrobacteraceae bacterium]